MAPQEPAQPDPDLALFNQLVAWKAVVDTFTDLIESCTAAAAGSGCIRCIICGADMGDEGCNPSCSRLRAERALAFLIGKGRGTDNG